MSQEPPALEGELVESLGVLATLRAIAATMVQNLAGLAAVTLVCALPAAIFTVLWNAAYRDPDQMTMTQLLFFVAFGFVGLVTLGGTLGSVAFAALERLENRATTAGQAVKAMLGRRGARIVGNLTLIYLLLLALTYGVEAAFRPLPGVGSWELAGLTVVGLAKPVICAYPVARLVGVIPAIVDESDSPFIRSWQLTRGHSSSMFVLALLWVAALWLPAQLLDQLQRSLPELALPLGALDFLFDTLVWSITSVAAVVIYYRLRSIKEGRGLQRVIRVFS